MASSEPSDAAANEIVINVKGPSELKLQITISTDKTVGDLKQAIADKADVTADRQRLIYSGRVLKDEDVLSTYKIQTAHTIHMVKGAARAAAPAAAPQPLPTMQAGQNPHDPLTQLNGPMGFGAMAGFNPFADMGLNPNDPNMMQTMLNSPQFLQQMSSVMSNPAVLDQIIASNPQLAAMGPQVREVFQSEHFRQMMSNPDTLRMMFQMSRVMRDSGVAPPGAGGMGGLGGLGAGGGFPAPGLPSTARAPDGQTGTGAGTTPAGGAMPNPFINFGIPPPTWTGSTDGSATAGTGAGAAPGAFDPETMQRMLAAMGGSGAGAGPFGMGGLGGMGGFGAAPAAPADSRPPEERFQVQLEQLQGMGFTNATQNVRALLATGGNVHSAIDYILNGGGL
ncbi:uncharacterized protein BXZ73DRAFT_107579 [Epithele typhae]|uniref:uncharacterized protein n=1 Tax=Epithele typhae TaxID=378194 RepID=UPI002007D86E|nr:uncharacterized protein BXZ73DRAFT_107579 [Epithele typhae]KAH9912135.1 hypothetical protein BXZ73DRAFT_107579 [Epithele typhae]